MKLYMVTDNMGYGVTLIGLFDSLPKAEEARRKYLGKGKKQEWLDESLATHVGVLANRLETDFYRRKESREYAENFIALTDEERAYQWMDSRYKIRELELNTNMDEILYME